MKPKAPPLKFLLGLIIAITAIGFTACSNEDDNLGVVTYQGYIEDIQADTELFTIRITKTPHNPKSNMPMRDDLIGVDLKDFSYLDLNVEQKISFRIVSAQGNIIPAYGLPRDYISWHCKIIITKL